MKGIFWLVLILLFLLVNEYLSKFALAVFVGDLAFSGAYERTFSTFSLTSYLLAASFRAIPFIALGLFAAKTQLNQFPSGKLVLWLLMLALAAFHFYGYWGMQYSLFTPEHTSSTSALAIISVPVGALMLGFISYGVGLMSLKAYRLFKSKAS